MEPEELFRVRPFINPTAFTRGDVLATEEHFRKHCSRLDFKNIAGTQGLTVTYGMLTEQPRLNNAGELELVMIEFYTDADKKYACAANRDAPPSPLLWAIDRHAKLKYSMREYGKPTLELAKGSQPAVYGKMAHIPSQEHPGVLSGMLAPDTQTMPILDIYCISYNSLARWYGCLWAPDGVIDEHFEQ